MRAASAAVIAAAGALLMLMMATLLLPRYDICLPSATLLRHFAAAYYAPFFSLLMLFAIT